jgi:hypothetical protein
MFLECGSGRALSTFAGAFARLQGKYLYFCTSKACKLNTFACCASTLKCCVCKQRKNKMKMKPVISRLENYRTQRAANEQRTMAAPRLSHRGCGGSSHMSLAMIMVCERAEKLIRALTQENQTDRCSKCARCGHHINNFR